jgi:hypothetical protein
MYLGNERNCPWLNNQLLLVVHCFKNQLVRFSRRKKCSFNFNVCYVLTKLLTLGIHMYIYAHTCIHTYTHTYVAFDILHFAQRAT